MFETYKDAPVRSIIITVINKYQYISYGFNTALSPRYSLSSSLSLSEH